MRTFVVTPPAPIVTWAEADAHLKLSGDTTDQALILSYIAAATATIDGPTGWLGRAIGPQTLEARLDSFGCGSIVLPYPPHIDIVSVKYIDADGTEQTVAADKYELLGASLVPAYDETWPDPRAQREAVRVRYRAGFVADATADPLVAAVPAPITAAILLMVGDLYRFRATAGMGNMSAVPMSTTVENLLGPLRVWA